MPLRRLRPEVVGTETWTGPSIGLRSFQRIAAEDRAGTTSEHHGHEAPVEAQASVPYCVDALVDAVELAPINAIANRPRTQTHVFELPPRSHTMLSRGDSRHCNIGRVAFLTHVGT